ncbi:hypothetical protein [Thalassomonas actiniarum]|uniref:Uncharacterized protein n=1 Tax=Thalassomonas actiniarum TaxID=485447 RepID=A0AAE9YT25_9GAMM|nr:hypothetical protein [Thalassomonas actiniarum]WDD99958.1 hypothetical protein SG35_004665 [Thalassomonas actiniarum]
MSDILQYILYYGDIFLMIISLIPILICFKNKNWPLFTFSFLFLIVVSLRHLLIGFYSGFPRAEKVYYWYQTFEYLYFGAFIASVAIHALLLWTTSRTIKIIYVLMTINVCFYAYMHWQRNIMGWNDPDWTWDLYSWTVAPINYIIAAILLFASMKGVRGRDGRSIS